MKASLALAERRPDELREAVEKLGQEPPSNRQLLLLRLTGLIAPPPGAGVLTRVRGILLLAPWWSCCSPPATGSSSWSPCRSAASTCLAGCWSGCSW